MIRKTRQCLLVFCMCSTALVAQVSTGSLSGTVTDSAGAAVPGAQVVARQEATGQTVQTVTTDAGIYVLPTLATGQYVITVEKQGFKKVNRTNVEIRVAQRLTMDMTLELGDVRQTVEVTAETPLLETTNSERGQNISTLMMSNLPLFTGGIRNPEAFVTYMPGVNSGAGETSISGSGGRGREVLIDGGSLTIPESGGVVFNFPSAEMFGEFKLLTGTYSSEYGRFGGGVEIFVTKSGTNDIHGGAFLNLRRDIWTANSWQNNSRGIARPKERFNEIGGAIGGPIFIPKIYDGRNKTFWYFTYTKDQRPASISFANPTVPTSLMKQGNFSELNAIVYDPATTRVVNGVTVRDPFPGNIIPQDRFSKVAKNLLPLIPNPTRSTLASNYDFVNQQIFDRTIYSLKFDHMITDNSRASFWMSRENQMDNNTTNFAGPIGNGLQNFQKPQNYRINHDWSIRPTFLMHTTLGITYQRQLWDVPNQAGFASKLGIPGVPDVADAMPRIQFRGAAGYSAYGVQDGKVANGGQNNDTIQLTQGYSWLRGSHEFKFGWDARWLKTTAFDYAGANGLYVFDRLQTGLPGVTNSGNEFASLLLGAVAEGSSLTTPVLFPTIYYNYMSGYFQDNWKISRRLTLNLGFRYEVPINWHAANGDYSSISLTTPNPGAGGRPGALVFAGEGQGRTGQKYFWPTDYSNVGPRLGFAYQLASKTVLRGGWGIYYQTLGNGGCGCREGFANTNQVVPQGNDPAFNWDNGLPVAGGFRQPPVLDPSFGNFKNVDYLGENFGKAPRIYNWSVNLQHEVKSFLFDVAYVANRGHGLNSTININQLPVSELSRGGLLTQQLSSAPAQAAGIKEPFADFGTNRTVAQALRPYPQFLNVSSRNSGDGRTWYDSMQAKVERRFGRFQMMVAYTWSKSLTMAHFRQIFSQGAQVAPQDSYNIRDSKTLSPFDQPHVLNILSTLELPFGRGRRFFTGANRAVDTLISGWTISGAQRYYSGNLIQIVTPGNPLGSSIFALNTKANRNNALPIQTGFDRTSLDPNNPAAVYFTPGVFTAAPANTLGTNAFYDTNFRQPRVFVENLSIAKRTTLVAFRDHPIHLIYRADAFNLFNRTNFGVIGTIGNANFGRATNPQQNPRLITMGLRLEF